MSDMGGDPGPATSEAEWGRPDGLSWLSECTSLVRFRPVNMLYLQRAKDLGELTEIKL